MMLDLLHPQEPQHFLALLYHTVDTVFRMSVVYTFLIKLYLIIWLSDYSIHQAV